uniref:Uncharacterized protein n=1 Tax=uncultured organism TaxID=155900 RepID=M1Q2Z3_9ZZZZ|nr:hypothetical protein FLSS-15_0013 [uncultured organism]
MNRPVDAVGRPVCRLGHDPEGKRHRSVRTPDRGERSPPMVGREEHECTGGADTRECNGSPPLDEAGIDVEEADNHD